MDEKKKKDDLLQEIKGDFPTPIVEKMDMASLQDLHREVEEVAEKAFGDINEAQFREFFKDQRFIAIIFKCINDLVTTKLINTLKLMGTINSFVDALNAEFIDFKQRICKEVDDVDEKGIETSKGLDQHYFAITSIVEILKDKGIRS